MKRPGCGLEHRTGPNLNCPMQRTVGMQNVHHRPGISSSIIPVADPAVVARRLARRYRISIPHALLIANLSGFGGVSREARQ